MEFEFGRLRFRIKRRFLILCIVCYLIASGGIDPISFLNLLEATR